MSSGGTRENAGRKKIGKIVNTRVEQSIIDQIDLYFKGASRADRMRKCLIAGIESKRGDAEALSVSNYGSVASFYKTYQKLINILNGDDNDRVRIVNGYLLGCFTSNMPTHVEMGIEETIHKAIINELNKYSFSISEGDNKRCITPNVVGSVIEKLVNQKEAGAYYTPQDTTLYITQYSVIFALINKCNMPTLKAAFYAVFEGTNNLAVLNNPLSPVDGLAKAIKSLSEDDRRSVFEHIKTLTIADPTCGTGAFIISAADVLVKLYKLTNMYLYTSLSDYVVNIFENCLFGVDIMDVAITHILLRCKLYLYNLGIGREVVERIAFNFVCGDALTPIDNVDVEFSWTKQFPSVFNCGGFDCIIGNPPYVEVPKRALDEAYYGVYSSIKCGNSFAFILEQSLNILKKDGYLGMIVPISLTSTPRMSEIRKVICDSCQNVYIANFSDRPSCLFTGVHQKLSILFLKKTKSDSHSKIYTSGYTHWSKGERGTLFSSIRFYRTTKTFINDNGICKLGDEIKANILRRVLDMPYSFTDAVSPTENTNRIYVNQRMTFWLKCFSNPEPSNEYKKISLDDKYNRKAVAALLNSSLFFLIWESFSDCWHVTKRDLALMKFGEAFLLPQNQARLAELEEALEQKLYATREYVYTKQTDYIYVHRKCMDEITAINQAVADVFSFSQQEREYIQNYQLNYRLSISLENSEDSN